MTRIGGGVTGSGGGVAGVLTGITGFGIWPMRLDVGIKDVRSREIASSISGRSCISSGVSTPSPSRNELDRRERA